MKKYIVTISFIFRLFLGGVMITSGAGKFFKSSPTSKEVVEKVNTDSINSNPQTLQKVLYINGLKQTGYFWQVVALCELIFGIFLILYRTYFIDALFMLPITLHIFLFHLYLEPDEVGELIYCGLLFIINIVLIFTEKDKWKNLFNKIGPYNNIVCEVIGNRNIKK